MQRTPNHIPLLCLVMLTALIGCGKKSPTKVAISGKVTINGKAPGTAGYTLAFIADNGGGTAIEVKPDGTFSGKAVLGKNKVELSNAQASHNAQVAKPKTIRKARNGNAPDTYGAQFAAQTIEITSDAKLTLDFKAGKGKGTAGGH